MRECIEFFRPPASQSRSFFFDYWAVRSVRISATRLVTMGSRRRDLRRRPRGRDACDPRVIIKLVGGEEQPSGSWTFGPADDGRRCRSKRYPHQASIKCKVHSFARGPAISARPSSLALARPVTTTPACSRCECRYVRVGVEVTTSSDFSLRCEATITRANATTASRDWVGCTLLGKTHRPLQVRVRRNGGRSGRFAARLTSVRNTGTGNTGGRAGEAPGAIGANLQRTRSIRPEPSSADLTVDSI